MYATAIKSFISGKFFTLDAHAFDNLTTMGGYELWDEKIIRKNFIYLRLNY